jgi:hypothetical protein
LLNVDDSTKLVMQEEKPEYLLNVNEQDYIGRLANRFSLEPLTTIQGLLLHGNNW